MAATELRQAAATLRAKATASFDASDSTQWWTDEGLSEAMYSMDDISMTGVKEDAAYLSLFHPNVGLALADWLDHEANAVEGHNANMDRFYGKQGSDFHVENKTEALAIARLINGGAS